MDPSRYHHLILFSSSPFGAYKVEDIDGNARYSCLGFRNAPAGLLAGFFVAASHAPRPCAVPFQENFREISTARL